MESTSLRISRCIRATAPFTWKDSGVQLGATVAYNTAAAADVQHRIKTFLIDSAKASSERRSLRRSRGFSEVAARAWPLRRPDGAPRRHAR